jgi:hypothetical protein
MISFGDEEKTEIPDSEFEIPDGGLETPDSRIQ